MTYTTATISDLKEAIHKKAFNRSALIFSNKLVQDELKFVAELRKHGTLRCSNYEFDFKIIEALVKLGLTEKSLSQPTREYFESVKSLIYIARSIRRIHNDLIKEINKGYLKSYLVLVDSLFWQVDSAFLIDSKKSSDFNKEEIAIAFSCYFYYLCKFKQNHDVQRNPIVDTKGLQNNYFLDNLANFYKISQFKEWEVLVDKFNYKLIQKPENTNQITLQYPSTEIEKSISFGHINYESQNTLRSLDSLLTNEYSQSSSLIKFATNLSIELKYQIFSIESFPAKRIVMKIPYIEKLINLIKRDRLFSEELSTIKFLQKTLLIDERQIREVEIFPEICLFDIIKFQRIFLFLFLCFRSYIESENLSKSKLFWRSILPVLSRNSLHSLLSIFFEGGKASKLIELLSWELTSEKIFDIQSFPFISNAESFILPLGILANSNLARNILQSRSFRFDAESSVDPIGNILHDTFTPISSFFITNITYSFMRKRGEIDAIVVIDDCTFIFECKNSLHPTSPFEMRSSYDYIQKGASQLEIITKFWQDDQFVSYLEKKLKYKLPRKLCIAIVTGNKIFSGLREKGYPIRHLNELCNIIRTGKISIGCTDLSSNKTKNVDFKIWEKDIFTSNDLIKYIEQDSVHQCFFDAMISNAVEVQIKNTIVTQMTYSLDVEKLWQELESKFEFAYS